MNLDAVDKIIIFIYATILIVFIILPVLLNKDKTHHDDSW